MIQIQNQKFQVLTRIIMELYHNPKNHHHQRNQLFLIVQNVIRNIKEIIYSHLKIVDIVFAKIA